MACAEMDIGLHRARVARLSVMGELGYEINRPSVEHRQLYKTLLDAGGDHGLVQVGFYAMGSLRVEKSFGIWSREFSRAYTPTMSGLDRFVAWDRDGFIGRDAALAERERVRADRRGWPVRRLCDLGSLWPYPGQEPCARLGRQRGRGRTPRADRGRDRAASPRADHPVLAPRSLGREDAGMTVLEARSTERSQRAGRRVHREVEKKISDAVQADCNWRRASRSDAARVGQSRFQRHVTATLDGPFLGLLHQDRADQSPDRRLVGKDPDD